MSSRQHRSQKCLFALCVSLMAAAGCASNNEAATSDELEAPIAAVTEADDETSSSTSGTRTPVVDTELDNAEPTSTSEAELATVNTTVAQTVAATTGTTEQVTTTESSAVASTSERAAPQSPTDAIEVLTLTNSYRQGVGCPALRINTDLNSAATSHANDMALNDFFDHVSSNGDDLGDRVGAVDYEFRNVAENIALGQRSAEQVVAAWLGSPGHRRNIQNCALTEMGLARVDNYWVQVLGTQL